MRWMEIDTASLFIFEVLNVAQEEREKIEEMCTNKQKEKKMDSKLKVGRFTTGKQKPIFHNKL